LKGLRKLVEGGGGEGHDSEGIDPREGKRKLRQKRKILVVGNCTQKGERDNRSTNNQEGNPVRKKKEGPCITAIISMGH